MIEAELLRVATKLRRVREMGLRCFGSDSHKFRLNPPLSAEDVAAFEEARQIQLPADYRSFLLVLGNGGAGPDYGILPLQRWSMIAGDVDPGWLARPSVLRPNLRADQSTNDADEMFWGALTLVHQGCGYYSLLIVSGEYRGRIVHVDADGGLPYFMSDTDFISWYERWLDELIAAEPRTLEDARLFRFADRKA